MGSAKQSRRGTRRILRAGGDDGLREGDRDVRRSRNRLPDCFGRGRRRAPGLLRTWRRRACHPRASGRVGQERRQRLVQRLHRFAHGYSATLGGASRALVRGRRDDGRREADDQPCRCRDDPRRFFRNGGFRRRAREGCAFDVRRRKRRQLFHVRERGGGRAGRLHAEAGPVLQSPEIRQW